jgi:HD-GYP domain-containing protein (c-di-GMP phosphodiesterase class II)
MGMSLPALAVAGVTAIVINRTINTGIFAVYRSARFGRPIMSDWLQSVSYVWPNQFLAAPLAVVLANIGNQVKGVELGLGLTFLAGLVLPINRQEYAYYISSQKMLDEIVEASVRTLEGMDPNAREHGDRVAGIAVETGRLLRMPERSLTALRLACRLHDVGLLSGTEDRESAESRAVVGGRILGRFPDPLVAKYVAAQSERWDGAGVPNHLAGNAIPLGARILSASEIYDRAVSGLAPFDMPLSPVSARSHLISLSGTVLDPTVVMALLRAADQRESTSAVQ